MSLLTKEKRRPAVAKPAPLPADLHERIAKRAYELFEEGGCENGKEMDHWLEAEREVREHYSAA